MLGVQLMYVLCWNSSREWLMNEFYWFWRVKVWIKFILSFSHAWFLCFCFRLSSFDDCEIWFIFYVVSLTTKVIVISWYKTIHNIKDKIIFLCASCCFFNHKKPFKKLLKSGVGILIFHSLCRNLVDYLYAQLSRYVLTNGLGVEYWIY